MKLYYSLVGVLAILCFSMTSVTVAYPPLPAPQLTNMPQKLVDFNAISVRGPIKLLLLQPIAGDRNFIQIVGEQRSPMAVSIKNSTLSLEAEASREPTVVRVGVAQLNQLTVDAGASVSSQPLSSASLSIDAHTTGSINLEGMITLTHLLTSGAGLIHIQWIDTPRLEIDGADSSQIQLAGVAGSVEMRLRNKSQFEGRYLRVDRMMIQTRDFSSAELLVNDSLRAFALDESHIYYYKRPAEFTEFTSGSGRILQLDWGQ